MPHRPAVFIYPFVLPASFLKYYLVSSICWSSPEVMSIKWHTECDVALKNNIVWTVQYFQTYSPPISAPQWIMWLLNFASFCVPLYSLQIPTFWIFCVTFSCSLHLWTALLLHLPFSWAHSSHRAKYKIAHVICWLKLCQIRLMFLNALRRAQYNEVVICLLNLVP